MYVAHRQDGELTRLAELSDKFQLSHNHLVKVVNRLIKLGWIASTRGRNGGIELAVDAQALSLATIVRELEGDFPLVDCHKNHCVLESACNLIGILDRGLNHFYDYLDNYYLSDLVQPPTAQLISKLQLV